jgi:hypothetical protein
MRLPSGSDIWAILPSSPSDSAISATLISPGNRRACLIETETFKPDFWRNRPNPFASCTRPAA